MNRFLNEIHLNCHPLIYSSMAKIIARSFCVECTLGAMQQQGPLDFPFKDIESNEFLIPTLQPISILFNQCGLYVADKGQIRVFLGELFHYPKDSSSYQNFILDNFQVLFNILNQNGYIELLGVSTAAIFGVQPSPLEVIANHKNLTAF